MKELNESYIAGPNILHQQGDFTRVVASADIVFLSQQSGVTSLKSLKWIFIYKHYIFVEQTLHN